MSLANDLIALIPDAVDMLSDAPATFSPGPVSLVDQDEKPISSLLVESTGSIGDSQISLKNSNGLSGTVNAYHGIVIDGDIYTVTEKAQASTTGVLTVSVSPGLLSAISVDDPAVLSSVGTTVVSTVGVKVEKFQPTADDTVLPRFGFSMQESGNIIPSVGQIVSRKGQSGRIIRVSRPPGEITVWVG